MDAREITFALTDTSAGYEASPQKVRLAELSRFLVDVETFLKGEQTDIDPAKTAVSIERGSVAIRTEPLIGADRLFSDLASLIASPLLERIDAKRRAIIERWQTQAKQRTGIAFRISTSGQQPIIVDDRTDFRADDADQWVQVERYVRGEIQDLGGATKSNANVRLPDGNLLVISTDRATLRDDSQNRLYKPAMLRIKAQYNVFTRKLRNARLVEFVEYAPTLDPSDMQRLTERGSTAWRDVGDPTAWVDELRGGSE